MSRMLMPLFSRGRCNLPKNLNFESPLKQLTTKLACSALHSLGVYKRKSCQGTSSQDMDLYCRNMNRLTSPLHHPWLSHCRMTGEQKLIWRIIAQLLQEAKLETVPLQFNYLGAKAATISLSRLGKYFSFDSFSKMYQNQQRKHKPSKNNSSQSEDSKHEAPGRNCPITWSYQAATSFLPSMAKPLKPPSRVNFSCPPAIVAARAALSATRSAKILIPPQASLLQILVIAVMGVAANVPLSMWRQHTQTFSLSWFTAVFAAVPFVYVLSKSVLMSHTFSFSIATCLLGQVIGTMAERYHSGAVATMSPPPPQTESGYVYLIQLAISVWIVSFRVSSHDTSLHVSRRRASQNSSPTM